MMQFFTGNNTILKHCFQFYIQDEFMSLREVVYTYNLKSNFLILTPALAEFIGPLLYLFFNRK